MISLIEQKLIEVIQYCRSHHPNYRVYITEKYEKEQYLEYLLEITYPYKGNKIWSFKTNFCVNNLTQIKPQLINLIETQIKYQNLKQTKEYINYV